MEPHERIIVALDVPTLAEATPLAQRLRPDIGLFKVGLELLTAEGAPRVVSALREVFVDIFYDGKFNDIPNTVAGAIRAATALNVQMVNVHCLGGRAMMQAAVTAAQKAVEDGATLCVRRPIILGVTVLTSLSDTDLETLGIAPRPTDDAGDFAFELCPDDGHPKVRMLVRTLARLAQQCGLDGVIASPQEIRLIREACGPDFLIVTPGVRPAWAAAQDQKRVMTPGEAISAGADYLVIGRPILKPPPEIGSPVDAAKRIADEIAAALAVRERTTT